MGSLKTSQFLSHYSREFPGERNIVDHFYVKKYNSEALYFHFILQILVLTLSSSFLCSLLVHLNSSSQLIKCCLTMSALERERSSALWLRNTLSWVSLFMSSLLAIAIDMSPGLIPSHSQHALASGESNDGHLQYNIYWYLSLFFQKLCLWMKEKRTFWTSDWWLRISLATNRELCSAGITCFEGRKLLLPVLALLLIPLPRKNKGLYMNHLKWDIFKGREELDKIWRERGDIMERGERGREGRSINDFGA